MKTINADHHARIITGEGVEDFYWPITHKSMTEFGERFYYECADLLREYPDQKSALIYKLAVNHFIAIAAGLFQSDLLKARADKDEVELVVPENWLVWPYTLRGNAPPQAPLLQTLRRIKSGPSFLKKLFDVKRYKRIFSKIKVSKDGMEIDGLKIAALTPDILTNNIIVTQRTGLISRQAQALSENVVLCRSDYWFLPVTEDEVTEAKTQQDAVLEGKLYDIVLKLYAEKGLSPSPYVKNYLTSLLTEMGALLRVHYGRLLERSDLPRRVWTGTGGNIWDTMLRSAVIEKGGRATAFDHGGGTAHVSIPLVGFIELWACHEFVTFNARQADDIANAAPGWPRLDLMAPKISFVPSDSSPLHLLIKPEKDDVKKIYVLSTLYDQDRGRSFAFYPDITYVDWQARLFKHLRDWGYEVYFKPHPESRSMPPDAFEDKLGVKIISGNFEDVLRDADLFLIDYTYTSIMIPAFLTNIPIVLVDFDELPWHTQAYDLIKRRASLVECGLNAQNRVDIDWDELRRAIKNATKKCNNHEFARTYYI